MGKVYLDYDADTLERQYNANYWPRFDSGIPDRWIKISTEYRRRANLRADVRYGDTPRQSIDFLIPASTSRASTVLFIHGRYWRGLKLHKQSYSFCMEQVVKAGARVAMIEYDLCPTVSMDTLVEQVRRACAFVYCHADEFGGDSKQLHITGHSAGGHLAAMMEATDWPSFQSSLPLDMVKSIIPISGLFELEPLRLCDFLNVDLRLDEAASARNSPALLRPSYPMPITVVVGGDESMEYRRQSRDFADRWRNHAEKMVHFEMGGEDHFEIIEGMARSKQSACHRYNSTRWAPVMCSASRTGVILMRSYGLTPAPVALNCPRGDSVAFFARGASW